MKRETVRRFGLLNSRVPPSVLCALSTVVGAVGRLMSASVIVCGRTLVATSLATGAEPNLTVPASALTGPESAIKGVPSARQNASVSSGSTRLHAGQRFMFGCRDFSQLSFFQDQPCGRVA